MRWTKTRLASFPHVIRDVGRRNSCTEMKLATPTKPITVPPGISGRLVRMFAAYNRRYLRRHFHTIRVLKSGLPPGNFVGPVVIYLNHAAWWDPLACLHLAQTFFRHRASYAPIDAVALQRYSFFKYLGFYGVEQQSTRGAIKFLRTTCAILSSSRNAVWLTPQGRFMDVRERPLRLERGIGELATRLENVLFLPLAIEYAYWTEPRPEILVSFGEPAIPGNDSQQSAQEWTKFFSNALEEVQDELAARSCRRKLGEWRILDQGTSGVGVIYDTWRRLRALAGGNKFVPDHHTEDLR